MSSLHRLVFWVLLLALPVQATAAPGWVCAQAGHHANLVVQVEHHHDHSVAASAGHDDAVFEHGHAAVASLAAVDGGDATETVPAAGKCSACSGCCTSGAAAPPLSALTLPTLAAFAMAAHLAPAFTTPAGDGLFRPPRTLTV